MAKFGYFVLGVLVGVGIVSGQHADNCVASVLAVSLIGLAVVGVWAVARWVIWGSRT